MAKRSRKWKPVKAMKLDAAPLLLTDVLGGQWQGGVLMLNVRSGDLRGTLALGPEASLRLLQAASAASRDSVAPFNRTAAALRVSLAQEEAKP